jgi:hypothetical protein
MSRLLTVSQKELHRLEVVVRLSPSLVQAYDQSGAAGLVSQVDRGQAIGATAKTFPTRR